MKFIAELKGDVLVAVQILNYILIIGLVAHKKSPVTKMGVRIKVSWR